MSKVLLDELQIKITLRNKSTKNEMIFMVGQVELEYFGITFSYIRVMCDVEISEIYVEFPKFYNRGYYYWIKDKDDLEAVERKILHTFQVKAGQGNPDIPAAEIDERIIDSKYSELASFKQITFKNRKMK